MIPDHLPPCAADSTPVSTRKRAGGKRSKTGCRTCRARHIKCDEAPRTCNNCKLTGRPCDGYDFHRLPRAGRKTQAIATTPPVALPSGAYWVMNTDQQRAFAFFQHRTTSAFLGWFDSSLWQRLVLQMSQADPAVYHAVIAVSAIHQDFERQGMPLPREDLGNTWHRFALEQSSRSFALLNARRASQDPRLREVTLVCCLLFVTLELIRGQYDDAFRHLHCGLDILKELNAQDQLVPKATGPQLVEQSLVEAFAHLDMQSIQFGVRGPRLLIGEQASHYLSKGQVSSFRTLPEARRALDHLLADVLQFSSQSPCATGRQIASDYEALYRKQRSLCGQVDSYAQRFNMFRKEAYSRLSRKEQRGVDVIHLHQRTATLLLETCLLDGNDPVMDQYTPEFQRLLYLVEPIMNASPERPSVCLDMGIIPTLMLVAVNCRDYHVRWQAIEMLRSWPHREGPWDSNLVARIAEETMMLETSHHINVNRDGTTPNGDPEPSMRGVFFSVAEDQRQVRISYCLDGTEYERWVKLED
ncbi:C6 zinc finger domain protein [Aspergillus ellipticus CBS 707.79]|uniref:C6 zinc finger domain protein n=1 Tax=Aspergillus ellipticus CBS 707.79 TaxID=1448320 RepID=A0A319DP80_9EURO|nr:C6 zinc finger domain protein [Aspergillus ellipticus CBS 707.79]